MSLVSLNVVKRAADSLGLDARPEGDALSVRLRSAVKLKVRVERGQIQTSLRWAGRPPWLYRLGLLVMFAIAGVYVWRHPPTGWALAGLAAIFLGMAAEHLFSEWKVSQARGALLTKVRELHAVY
jgi:hypothetical protein